MFAFLAFTRTGKAMRAVADNPALADIKGIDAAPGRPHRHRSSAWGWPGIGGMLIGLDTTIDPLTGFRAILSIFAAAVVGGLGSIPGAVVGALVGRHRRGVVAAGAAAGLPHRGRLPGDPVVLRSGRAASSASGRTDGLMENYLVAMAVSAGIYALMALGLNVIWGMAGMVNLGLVGFFAVGAYTSALLTVKLGWPIAVGRAGRRRSWAPRSARGGGG